MPSVTLQSMGGRKFVLCCASLAIWTGLLLSGKLNEEHYVTLCMGTVAVYIAGNVYQKKVAPAPAAGAAPSP